MHEFHPKYVIKRHYINNITAGLILSIKGHVQCVRNTLNI